jgi:hypothetical protein
MVSSFLELNYRRALVSAPRSVEILNAPEPITS